MEHSVDTTESEWTTRLVAAREGDAAALGEICEQFREYLLIVAERGLNGAIRAKLAPADVVQQSLLEAVRDFAKFTGATPEELRAWLGKLVENNIIDVGRSFRQTQQRDLCREVPIDAYAGQLEIAAFHPTASSILLRRERDEQLQLAVRQLPDNRRRIIELRHREGLSYTQIAECLGISEVAARKIWSRAVQQLRKSLSSSDACQSAQFG